MFTPRFVCLKGGQVGGWVGSGDAGLVCASGFGALFGDGDDEAKVCCDHSISGVLEQPQL
jgi:hypothetical protein